MQYMNTYKIRQYSRIFYNDIDDFVQCHSDAIGISTEMLVFYSGHANDIYSFTSETDGISRDVYDRVDFECYFIAINSSNKIESVKLCSFDGCYGKEICQSNTELENNGSTEIDLQ